MQRTAQQIARNSLRRAGYVVRSENRTRNPISVTDLHILDKSPAIVPFRLNRMQRDLAGKLTGRDLVLKSRQLGASTYLEALTFCEALNTTARVAVMAHDDETTQKMRDIQQLFYDQLLDKPARAKNSATRVFYPDTNSMVYIGTAGNAKRGRGGTYSHVHGSEVAYWSDAAYIMAGVMQGVPKDGKVYLESSANGAQGWFYDQCMAALNGDSIWRLHFYEWWWGEEYRLVLEPGETLQYSDDEQKLVDEHGLTPEQIKWRRAKIRELTLPLFIQEYPEDPVTCFLTSGNSVFGDFSAALYGIPSDFPSNPAPIKGHFYTAGLDWGQTNDFTALSIMDATDNREVYLERWNQMRWDEMRARVIRACDDWGVQKIYVERNSASSNIENLQAEIESLMIDRSAEEANLAVVGFTMTNKSKSAMVGALYEGLHKDSLKLLNIPYATAELRQFTSQQTASGVWTYAAAGDGHDDTVIARMAAYRAALERIPDGEW